MSAATVARPRKHTRFDICDRHAWMYLESRERRAELCAEGGPVDGPCSADGPCRMYAGTDLFTPEVCVGEYIAEHGDPWAVNA